MIDEKTISVKIQLSCLKYYPISFICSPEISAGKLGIDKSEVSYVKSDKILVSVPKCMQYSLMQGLLALN